MDKTTNSVDLISNVYQTKRVNPSNRPQNGKKYDNPKPENVIMTGPPGVGKTTCAKILHKTYGFSDEKFQEVIGANLGLEELYQLLISADEDTTIYIDEAMSLSDRCSDILLKALDEQVLIIPSKKQSKE